MSADMKWYGDEVMDSIHSAIKAGLQESAQMIRDDSMAQVPVDSGVLIGDCKIDASNIDGLEVGVYYDTPYAVYQHEDIALSHPNGGKAKFLEDPMNENADTCVMKVADAIREVTG